MISWPRTQTEPANARHLRLHSRLPALRVSSHSRHAATDETTSSHRWRLNTLPRYYMCLVGTIRCVAPPPPVNIQAIDLSAGSAVTCAVHVTLDAYCWGDNTHGMLGIGSIGTGEGCTDDVGVSHPCSTKPRRVPHHTYAAISVGGQHVCATKLDGNAYCWGDNSSGQVGVPAGSYPPPPVLSPTLVQPPAGSTTRLSFISIAAGGASTCGVTTSQQLYCWGAGYGSVPVQQPGSFASVSQNYTAACALTSDQHSCAGWRGAYTYVSQGSSASHFCQIFGDRGDGFENTECWGNNKFGQLGYGKVGGTLYSNSPMAVPNMLFQAVTVGTGHTCAIQSGTGDAFVRGDNTWVQLGNGSTIWGSATPQRVTRVGVTYTRIAAGDGHTCAADALGAVWCWGLNTMGQLGTGSSTLWIRAQNWPTSFAGVGRPVQVRYVGELTTLAACDVVGASQPGSER